MLLALAGTMGGRSVFPLWIFMTLPPHPPPPPPLHARGCFSRVHVEREQEKIRALVNKRQKKKGWRRRVPLFRCLFVSCFVFFCVFVSCFFFCFFLLVFSTLFSPSFLFFFFFYVSLLFSLLPFFSLLSSFFFAGKDEKKRGAGDAARNYNPKRAHYCGSMVILSVVSVERTTMPLDKRLYCPWFFVFAPSLTVRRYITWRKWAPIYPS